MLLLNTALESIQRALQALEMAGPGEPPARECWLQARIHLTAARKEIERAIAWTAPPSPAPPRPPEQTPER